MQSHTHGNVYRANDVSRVIAQYGRKPPEQTRQAIQQNLSQEKERFLRLEQMRSQKQERSRSRGR